jgi:hypothetical protein
MTSMLTPVLALIVLSLLVWIWMYVTRIPAMQRAGIDPQNARHPGSPGHSDAFGIYLAWSYVGLRVVHTLIQCTVNNVTMRFSVFALSTLVLMAMAVREVVRVL